ncbi:MAG: Uncharacterised protein [Cryomorphaceae bacterium]|nr:MAG: Uncharacterised protein [Cryomorphaceae bacterium]
MLDLLKNPRIPDARAPDHDPIDTIPVAVFQRFGATIDVPVPENRDVQARIVLGFSDQRPVRLAFIHLFACASVNRYGLNAYILQTFRYLDDVFRIFIPT